MAAFLALVLMSTGSWTQDGVEFFENEEGGYSFAHPPSWEVTTDGVVSKLVAPSRAVVVSFGPGSSNSLRREAIRSKELIEKTYDAVTFADPLELTIGSGPALEITGTATNDAGVRVDFRVITVRVPDRTYAIVTFADTEASTGEVSAIDGIVSSFQPPAEAAEPSAPDEAPAEGAKGGEAGSGAWPVLVAIVLGGAGALLIASTVRRALRPGPQFHIVGTQTASGAGPVSEQQAPARDTADDSAEPEPEPGRVRVHLRDGRTMEGAVKYAPTSDTPVLLLDVIDVSDAEGHRHDPGPLDAFVPLVEIEHVEALEERDAGAARDE